MQHMLFKQQNKLFAVSVFSLELLLNSEVSTLYISRHCIKVLLS